MFRQQRCDDDDDGEYDSDGQERKQHRQRVTPRRLAAASSSSTGSGSSTAGSSSTASCQSYQTMALSHLCSGSSKSGSLAMHSFPDLAYCSMAGHNQIVEQVPLLPRDSYKPACGKCPLQPERSLALQLVVRGNPRTIADLDAVRAKWQAAAAAMKIEMRKLDQARARSLHSMETLVDSVSHATAERDSWLQYALVVHDVVRPFLVKQYHQNVAKPLHAGSGMSPNVRVYEDFLAAYLRAFSQRSMSMTDPKPPTVWCFVHERAGLMLPTCKHLNPACNVCKAADVPKELADAMASDAGFVSGHTFTQMCGPGNTSAAAAASASASMTDN